LSHTCDLCLVFVLSHSPLLPLFFFDLSMGKEVTERNPAARASSPKLADRGRGPRRFPSSAWPQPTQRLPRFRRAAARGPARIARGIRVRTPRRRARWGCAARPCSGSPRCWCRPREPLARARAAPARRTRTPRERAPSPSPASPRLAPPRHGALLLCLS
jgi:hypothetical protein